MKIAALVVTVAVGTLGVSGWRANQRSSTPTHPLALYVTPAANVDPADTGTMRIPGQVQPRTKVCISSTVSLPIVELPFKEGDRVTHGDIQGSVPRPASVLATSTEEKDGTRYFKAEISLDTGGRVIPAGLSGEAKLECPADH